jgi:hypothetical protein
MNKKKAKREDSSQKLKQANMSSTLLEHARQNLELCEKHEASVGTYLEETPSGVCLMNCILFWTLD